MSNSSPSLLPFGFCLFLFLALLFPPPASARLRYQLENGYFLLGSDDGLTYHLAVDPSGKARYQIVAEELRLDSSPTAAQPRVDVKGRQELTIAGLTFTEVQEVNTGPADHPAQLKFGGSLGQSFTVEGGMLQSVSAHMPTWHTTDSSVTITLRRDGPGGPVVATQRFERLVDNAWNELKFDPQPPGRYYLAMGQPEGQVGWWSSKKSKYAGWVAFENARPVAGQDRDLRVLVLRELGKLDLSVKLDTNQLICEVKADPPKLLQGHELSLLMGTSWKKDGYDVSRKAGVLFSHFTNSAGQYYPIEQLKRRDFGEPPLAHVDWIRATGSGDHDLVFRGGGRYYMSWRMQPRRMDIRVHHAATKEPAMRWVMEVWPHSEELSGLFPAFYSSSPVFDDVLNHFFWERNFSWRPGSSTTWFEWAALRCDWVNSSFRQGERDCLVKQKIGSGKVPPNDDGYVYTWGDGRGWPFPDNAKFDTRHFDTNAKFILGCWRYFCWTGDKPFLLSQLGRMRRAMDYQLQELQGQKEGVIVTNSANVTGRDRDCGSNYWDILPFGGKDAYCSIYYFASLQAMAEIESLNLGGDGTIRTPQEYLDLSIAAQKAYTKLFWDTTKGRFIGCIDADGKPHDYGFTFLNLEAMAYGLATPEQARLIYLWMETAPTSTGKADTYTKWIFAPRATTEWNPPRDKPQTPNPSWWFEGWGGTDFGDQCQDGGAILYTSFYDLVARARFFNAENAWKRFGEILHRYQDPDRLCGGPRLSRGEWPQQENPGAVGTDVPFPESGLVPCAFLYVFLGVQARVDGLHISPNLPASLSFGGVKHLSYYGIDLDLKVTKNKVEVNYMKDGEPVKWEHEITPGRDLVLTP